MSRPGGGLLTSRPASYYLRAALGGSRRARSCAWGRQAVVRLHGRIIPERQSLPHSQGLAELREDQSWFGPTAVNATMCFENVLGAVGRWSRAVTAGLDQRQIETTGLSNFSVVLVFYEPPIRPTQELPREDHRGTSSMPGRAGAFSNDRKGRHARTPAYRVRVNCREPRPGAQTRRLRIGRPRTERSDTQGQSPRQQPQWRCPSATLA